MAGTECSVPAIWSSCSLCVRIEIVVDRYCLLLVEKVCGRAFAYARIYSQNTAPPLVTIGRFGPDHSAGVHLARLPRFTGVSPWAAIRSSVVR